MRPSRWVFLLLFLALAGALMACPTCKDQLANSEKTAGLARGFYYSILLMLGIFFSLVAFLVFKIAKEARTAQSPPPR